MYLPKIMKITTILDFYSILLFNEMILFDVISISELCTNSVTGYSPTVDTLLPRLLLVGWAMLAEWCFYKALNFLAQNDIID